MSVNTNNNEYPIKIHNQNDLSKEEPLEEKHKESADKIDAPTKDKSETIEKQDMKKEEIHSQVEEIEAGYTTMDIPLEVLDKLEKIYKNNK